MLQELISFFVMYISRIDITEMLLLSAMLFCILSAFFRLYLKQDSFFPIVLFSIYFAFLIEITILSRETSNMVFSTEDMFITIRMMLQHTEESQMYPDILGNILLFVPCGILLKRFIRKSGWCIFACFLISLAIESTQLITGRGIFEIADLLFNTLGGIVGILINTFLHGVSKKDS